MIERLKAWGRVVITELVACLIHKNPKARMPLLQPSGLYRSIPQSEAVGLMLYHQSKEPQTQHLAHVLLTSSPKLSPDSDLHTLET